MLWKEKRSWDKEVLALYVKLMDSWDNRSTTEKTFMEMNRKNQKRTLSHKQQIFFFFFMGAPLKNILPA